MRKTACASVVALLACCLPVCAQSKEARPVRVAPAGARLANADDVRKKLGLVPEYENVPGIESVKIAVGCIVVPLFSWASLTCFLCTALGELPWV